MINLLITLKNMAKVLFKSILCSSVLLISLLSQEKLRAQAIDYQTKKIQIAMGTEPPDLNYLKASDQVSFFIIEHVMEGLLTYGEHGELIPGIAEHWQLNEKEAVFFLRKNARWSDGEKVTAHDFVFAWQ